MAGKKLEFKKPNNSKMGKLILNQAQICELLGVSRTTIQKYHGHGMPVVKRGQYDGAAAVAWFVHYKVSLATSEQKKVEDSEGKHPEIRLLEARALKIEMENKEKLKILIHFEVVQALFLWFSTLISNAFESLGARLANIVAGMDDPAEIQAEILRESRQARRLLADKLEKAQLNEVLKIDSNCPDTDKS